MYDRILLPLDGSKLSESSLKHVKTIAAGSQGTETILLTVIEPLTAELTEALYSVPQDQVHNLVQKAIDKLRQKAEDDLNRIADDLRKDGLTVKTVVIKREAEQGVAETILDYAKNNKVDLIMMSTHGRSGISRWALGSVTDKVTRHAGVPVITVVPEGFRK
jgi:nucleotide-binding universal stress UspA family protein